MVNDVIRNLTVLDANHPAFPHPDQALMEPDGLLAVGGNLHSDTLIRAYQQGVFPWYEQRQPILWWSPAKRAVIYPNQFHISRSLAKTLRRGEYEVTTDRACAEVIRACAIRTPGDGTWITPAMISAYNSLFEIGVVHSVECWMEGKLAGGLYGVITGGVFSGESMFSRRTDASKIALAHLTHAMALAGFKLIDCQIGNQHLYSLGAALIERHEFLKALQSYRSVEMDWPVEAISARINFGDKDNQLS
jgi:leucyl/phenylalanyl-tRNA---protein transferase